VRIENTIILHFTYDIIIKLIRNVMYHRMYELGDYTTVLQVLVFIVTLFLAYFLVNRLTYQSGGEDGRTHPPSVGYLPVIGSSPYLPDFREIHHWSLNKSYKLGAVFTFKVGNV